MPQTNQFGTVLRPGFTTTTPNAPSTRVQQGLQDVVGGFNTAFTEANQANEARYQQLLGLSRQDVGQQQIGQTYDQLSALAAGQPAGGQDFEASRQRQRDILAGGTSQRQADIRSSFSEQNIAAQQQLRRSGLGGTTVGASIAGGFEREKQSSLNRLAEQFQGQRLGVEQFGVGQQAALGESRLQTQIGVAERGTQALSNLKERQQAQRLGIIERRQDLGPDRGAVSELIAGIGAQYDQGQGIAATLKALSSLKQ